MAFFATDREKGGRTTKTFIINLPSANKRREHILADATRCNLDFELIEAVNGRNLTEAELKSKVDLEKVRQFPNWLTPGMLGCSLSHHMVYGKILEMGLDCALIVEDDAALPANLTDIADSIQEKMFGNEIVLLHYSSFKSLQLSKHNATRLPHDRDLLFPMFLSGVGSTACYMITQGAARSLYEHLLPIRFSPDSFLHFHEEEMLESIRCIYPRVVDVIGAKSTVEAPAQSFLRYWTTDAIERYDVPVFNTLLRKLRLKSIESRLKVSLVDEASPFDITQRPNSTSFFYEESVS